MKEQNDVKENFEEETAEVTEHIETEAVELTEEVENQVVANEENVEEVAVAETDEDSEEQAVLSEDEVETEESEVIEPPVVKLSKHAQAQQLVEEARSITKDAENQLQECKLLLASDLKEYEGAKQALKENGMHACEDLLDTLGYISEEDEEREKEDENVVVFEPKEEVAPIYIQDVSSGGFTGFLMGIIAGLLTFVALIYVATEKVGITLDISKIPEFDVVKPIFTFYSSLIGAGENASMGAAIIVVVSLLVMWLVYTIRVSTKASANIHHATEQLAAAQEYTAQKSSCKDEMDKVDVYIHDAIKSLKTYQILFTEQKGKLERILHLEGVSTEDKVVEYHHKSMLEMRDTRELIDTVKDFMSIPMSEEGKLSGKSSLFLHRAKSRIQKTIDRLY